MRWGYAAAIAFMVSGCGRVGFAPSDLRDASGDGASADAARSCATSAYLICEDFESPQLDPLLWTTGGDVTRDVNVRHRGAASLRLHLADLDAAQGAGSWIAQGRTLASGEKTVWVRVWLRMNARPAGTNALQLLTLSQSNGPAEGDYVFVRANDTELYHQFDTRSASAGMAPPIDTWFCFVWNVELSTSTGFASLTSDVVPSIELQSTITQGSAPVDELGIGPFYAANNVDVVQPALDVWVDDVIVHSSMVSCAD